MSENNLIIAPSILSSEFRALENDLLQLEKGGADWIHIDVMDGHFVPNISFGQSVVKTINGITSLTLDVHLMIEKPERYIDEFAEAGADIITVHQEACPHIHRTIQQIHNQGAKAGVALNPGTKVSLLEDIISNIELVLIMSVNPGFGGQRFISSSIQKIKKTFKLIRDNKSSAHLEVDGGVDEKNAAIITEAGCNVLVSGSGIFKHSDLSEGVKLLRKAAAV